MPVLALLTALALAPGRATAQQNSPEATAAARKHLAEKANAPAAAASATRVAKPQPGAGKAARAAPPDDWNARLASCKQEAGMNLIKREKCVYANCKGHWGEGECPPGQDLPTKDSFKNPFKRSGS
jgi:hypothetical protein